MDPQVVIDLSRQALATVLMLAAPVLVVGIVIGIVIGILQAMTQIHDQTVMFVIRLVAAVVVISICLPWMIEHYSSFSRELIQSVPQNIMHAQH